MERREVVGLGLGGGRAVEVEEQKGKELGELGYRTRWSLGHICIRSATTTRYQEDWKFALSGPVVSALIASVHNADF
jgi:hypothetical protein